MQAGVQPADADDESQLPFTCTSVMEPGECVICFHPCAEFHTLCFNHFEHACMGCVMELRRRKLRCPICRAPLYEPGNPAYAWRERVAPVAARRTATLQEIVAMYREIEEIESRLALDDQ